MVLGVTSSRPRKHQPTLDVGKESWKFGAHCRPID